MSEESVAPYLTIAAFCEKLLEEKDGVLSAIRIIDRMFVDPAALDTPANFTPALEIALVLKFMSLRYAGKRKLAIKMLAPDGKERGILETPVVFDEDKSGVQVKLNLTLGIKDEGRFWAMVYIDDELFSRVPLEVIFQKAVSETPKKE